MMTKEQILAAVEEQQIRFIDLWFTDIMGMVKSVTIPSTALEGALNNGTHFDGSAIEGFARVAESDMTLIPDPNTFVVLPWDGAEERTARLICTVHTLHGEPFIGDPRYALVKVLRQAEEMGFTYQTGVELEFFLFRVGEGKALLPLEALDQSGYFDMTSNPAKAVLRRMVAILTSMGIVVDSTHHENGDGQHEVDLEYDHALAMADKVLTARVALKAVASAHNLHCTFMPRPASHLPGSGMHTHQSLHTMDGSNAFVDTTKEYGLSQTARYFLAGQLAHARAMCAILSPLINSYKRLGTSFEAPVYVTWAHINRGALIRVPHINRGKEAHTRLELRCPDPSSNPYLASAVMLAAGLDGIRQQMPLPDAVEESLLRQDRNRLRHLEVLPTSLGEALETLEQNDVILSALGQFISDRYMTAKRQEFDEYNRQITAWELDRYINQY